MSEQYWGCSDKMSEANFSPAETLPPPPPGGLAGRIRGGDKGVLEDFFCKNSSILSALLVSALGVVGK